MTISAYCSGCKKTYQVKDEQAGKRAKCPQGHVVVVPCAKPEASTPAEVLAAESRRSAPTQLPAIRVGPPSGVGRRRVKKSSPAVAKSTGRKLFFALASGAMVLIVGSSVIWLLLRTREPSFQGKKAGMWIEALKSESEDADGRTESQKALAHEAAVPVLVRAMQSGDKSVKNRATMILFDLGPRASAAIPFLISCLDSDDPGDRGVAATLLGKVGRDNELVASALAHSLDTTDSSDQKMRLAVAMLECNNNLDRALPVLATALVSDSLERRFHAAGALVMARTEHYGSQPYRYTVATALEPVMTSLLNSEGNVNVNMVVQTTREDMTLDLKLIRTPDAKTMSVAQRARRQVISVLTDKLSDDSAPVRRRAVMALSSFTPEAADAVPQIASLLDDEDRLVRLATIMSMSKIGVANESLVRRLLDLMKDDDSLVQTAAAKSLQKLGDAAVPYLISSLTATASSGRLQAVLALGNATTERADVISALAAAVADKDERVAFAACMALGNHGARAKGAIPALEQAVADDKRKAVQNVARATLSKIEDDRP